MMRPTDEKERKEKSFSGPANIWMESSGRSRMLALCPENGSEIERPKNDRVITDQFFMGAISDNKYLTLHGQRGHGTKR